jgi:ParB family chromosome partitioning protein
MAAKPSRPALGRGLASLLGNVAVPPPGGTDSSPPPGLRQIPLDLLDPNPFQPRVAFPQEGLEELAESIRVRGILQPILARSHPTYPERFYIIAGERRWRAAALAGLHEVPAIIREMSDTEAATAALIENLQREDLNPMEEAEWGSRARRSPTRCACSTCPRGCRTRCAKARCPTAMRVPCLPMRTPRRWPAWCRRVA